MNNNNPLAAPLPESLTAIMNGTMQQTVSMLLRSGGSRWSSLPLKGFASAEAALAETRAHSPHAPLPVIIHVDDKTEASGLPLPTLLTQLALQPHVAPMFLTDTTDVISALHQAGHPILIPSDGLDGQRLVNLLAATLTLTELKLANRQLAQQWELSENRFRDMADQFADWLWEVDTSLRLTFSSSRKRPAQSATRGSLFTAVFLNEERLRIEDDFADLIRTPRPFHDRDYWAADPYGTRICWSLSGTPVYGPNGAGGGQLLGFRGIARDVSPMKIATDQLYYLTNHDPLTGLANRNRFIDELARTLRMAGREGRTGALVLLDLDKFSLINHSHGHAAGDKALIHVAQILKDHVRTGDLVARLDGDQFAVILRDVRPEDMSNRIERLQHTLAARSLPLETVTISLQASGGIAYYPLHGGTAEELHAAALDALTAAKQHGPNRMEIYNPAAPVNAGAAARLQWVEFISACLAQPEERLHLHFQPIIALIGDRGTEFYEVLVRLRDENGQPLAAQQFMQVAEDFGFAPQIDRLVITRALGLMQSWQQSGRRVRLSLNISARTLDDPTFLGWLLPELDKLQPAPGMLVFELTETALLRDVGTAQAFIQAIRQHRAGFALDDCGVGYSSLAYLRDLDLDYIKIDGSFIRNLHTSPDDQAVVKALISIARQKRIATIAEMVEHAAALDMLKTLEIDYGQGFYFAPPSPMTDHVSPLFTPDPATSMPRRW